MKFRLNRKSLERLKALVRAGKFADTAWSFTPADSNALLGDPANWTEYSGWLLGIGLDKPDSPSTAGPNAPGPDKGWYEYPFGKGETVNLNALRAIVRSAKAAADNDVATAAAVELANALTLSADRATAAGAACDRDITFAAPVQIKAADAGRKVPTFEADAYTGVAMQLEGFNHPVVIDYDGLDVTEKSRPVLRDHDPKRPIGHTTAIGVVGGILKASGEISVVSPDAEQVVDAGKNKFPWQISVGAKVLRNQFIPAGDTGLANGKTWTGPIILARQTSLREISFLTLGADDNTSARIAANAAQKGAPVALKKKFAAWAKARNIQMADMEDDAMSKAFKSAYKAQMKCEADDPADEDDDGKSDKEDAKSAATPAEIQAAAARANAGANATPTAAELVKELRASALTERQRQTEISAVLDKYRSEVAADKFAPIEAKAIGGDYDLNKTELELIRARRPVVNSPNINTGAGSQVDGQIIAAAAARSCGVGEKAAYEGLDERAGNIAASMPALTIHGIIAASAGRLGIHCRPGGIDDSFLQSFIRADRESHRQQLQAHSVQQGGMIRASSGSGFSTMSLTGITENIMYKAMLESYTLQETVVSDIAYERDTNDFKPYKVYRLSASGTFSQIGPTGELKTMSLQDESYGGQVKTQGVLLVLKREDIINDDMGALMQTPQLVGEEAAQSREQTVLAAWLAGTSTVAPGASVGKTANGFNLFSTGAANYMSGGTSALSITTLTLAVQKFQEQKNVNGRPIGVNPDRLLVSPANRAVAENLFNGANLIVNGLTLPASSSGTSAAQTASESVNLNQHKGAYRAVVSPYLSSKFIGNDTQWGLLGNPGGGKATIQVGYLRGQRTPIIRQVETDAIMLGIAYQAIYDFGVSLLDYRCGQYSAGQ